MMMRSWLARPARRFLGTVVMLLGAQHFIHRLYNPPPELPPARVDRVVVSGSDGSRYEIRDPIAARRIAAFVRGPRERNGVRLPERTHHPVELYRVSFFSGDRPRAMVIWSGRLITVPAGRRQRVWYYLTEREGAELQRLMRP